MFYVYFLGTFVDARLVKNACANVSGLDRSPIHRQSRRQGEKTGTGIAGPYGP